MDIGKIIKNARLKKEYTQEELATLVGVKKSAVAKWENGRVSEIKRSNLKKLAEALDLKPTELLGSNESQHDMSDINFHLLCERLEYDNELLSLVIILSKLDSVKLSRVKNMLEAFID
ncbi:MAG: helix-turn-helix transcriptional regulator [Lachnospiraceae bacterium]|nr:helix-turn-helix transcriptional regulator [Lachnospiraceae bacterium]